MNQLVLENLHDRHPALTQAIAATYKEAAEVCLNRFHEPPTKVTLSDNGSVAAGEILWTRPTSRALAAWANEIDATEAGAYGCVIAGLEVARSLVAVQRAETRTGADYYVGPIGSNFADLENCLRLEISGVSAGDLREVSKRLLRKVRQALEGSSSLPAIAGVFGFATRMLMLQDVSEAS